MASKLYAVERRFANPPPKKGKMKSHGISPWPANTLNQLPPYVSHNCIAFVRTNISEILQPTKKVFSAITEFLLS